jgi:hypothetical protein
VIDCTFTGNSAVVDGGGLLNFSPPTATVTMTATVTGSTFTGNIAGSGGGIRNLGTVTVTDSTFAGNSATVHGGGIDNLRTATVTGSTFTGNIAGSGNGGLNNEPGALLTQFDNRFFDDQAPDVFP